MGYYTIENDNFSQNLRYDMTLRWGFGDAISEYLFELKLLEINYKVNNVDYLLSGNFKKGMTNAVFRQPFEWNRVFDTFNYNSSSTITLPMEASLMFTFKYLQMLAMSIKLKSAPKDLILISNLWEKVRM